ncbi:MAG: TfoX/Sxy family protein [Burkholderiales bacterium]|nr:TfoX/Sxy family protein [Burkholderiales bacterium]
MASKRLSSVRNLGPKSESMLATIGIHTMEELAARGAVDTFIALKKTNKTTSLNMLWALEGALSGRHWQEVVRDDRLRLLTELDARGVHL